MKNNDNFNTVYNTEVQRLLISHIIDNPDVFVRCQNIIKPEYFDDQLNLAIRFILSHANDHKAIASPALIQAKTGIEILSLSDLDIEMNEDWFLQEIVQFCRYRAIENLILEGIDLLQKNEYAVIEKRLRDALTISLVSDLGTSYFESPDKRLRELLDQTSMVSTGWTGFDKKLFGGFTRGGLNIFAGGSGSGKSLVLQNLAINWALVGFNVVYITLELSEGLVSSRIDSMLTGKSTKEVFKDIDTISYLIKMKGKKAGRLDIKALPQGGTTVNHIRAYIKEYQIQTGLKPDCLVVDYLDLMYPNNTTMDMSNLFVKDKFVCEELRGLMHESDLFGATASQLNRSSVQVQGEFDHSHIAGGISKINTADNVIAINAPDSMKDKGEIEFLFLKTRSAAAVGHRIKMKYDKDCMKISDFEISDAIETEKPMSVQELKKVSETKQKNEDVDLSIKTKLNNLIVSSRINL